MLRETRTGEFEVIQRGPRRPSRESVQQARDGLLLVLTERHDVSIRVAAELLGMPKSTALERLQSIPPDARERFLRGSSPLALVGLGGS